MSDDKFERLLTALPDIAKAVNAFESADVQGRAFDALVRALGVTDGDLPDRGGPTAHPEPSNGEQKSKPRKTADEGASSGASGSRRTRRRAARPVAADRNIDFRPQGKQSLRDFAAEKKPTNYYECNIVAVYYLEQVLEMPSIASGHVLAAYRDCNWKEPGDLSNSLAVTASRKSWLDTSDMNSIRTTAPGRNFVQHDMPLTPKKAQK